MKKIIPILGIVLQLAACASVPTPTRALSAEAEKNLLTQGYVKNPYCDDSYASYQVFQVLPGYVLVHPCKNTRNNTCKPLTKKVFMIPKEEGKTYTEGMLLPLPDGMCRTDVESAFYKDKQGITQVTPTFMFLPRYVKKDFLKHIQNLRGFDENNPQILTFPANSSAGFEWGYLLYLPDNLDTSDKLPILFVMTNTGGVASGEELRKRTFQQLRSERTLADQLGVPLLIPLVAREDNLYSHELSRDVLVLQEGPFKRLDKQIVQMFLDARKQLREKGIRTQDKMWVAGSSAAGSFAWRFTLLHPEYVLATVAAIQHYPTLPLKKWQGRELVFPIGVADVAQYTGSPFNEFAWQQVPIFVYEGSADYNDTLLFDECYNESSRALMHSLFDENAENDEQVRVRSMQKVLNQVAPNVQTHIYPNMGHSVMTEDTVRFFQLHLNGGPLKRITPTDTSSKTPPLPLKVSALYFGTQAPLTKDEQYLSQTDLTLKVQKSYMTHTLWSQGQCRFDILQNGKEILHDKVCKGIFSEEDFDLLQVAFSPQEMTKLKAQASAPFTVRSRAPKIITIPAELTFTMAD